MIANHVAHGLPTVTGFTESFALEAVFLAVAVLAGTLVPAAIGARQPAAGVGREPAPELGIGSPPESELVREAG